MNPIQSSAAQPHPMPGLLQAGERSPVETERADGSSAFVFVCDHASARLPRALGTLGLSEAQLSSHIAWDIGIAGVARRLAERLDAPLLLQCYSRLVIDCNRPLHAEDAISARSEWGQIDGNLALDAAQAEARKLAVFDPYHAAVAELLDRRQRASKPTVLVALHSFTPQWRGEGRPWHIGLMFRRDRETANVVLKLLRRDERLRIGCNEPYPISDDSDYTLPTHGEGRGIAHLGLEIRQDLIADEAGQKAWSGRLASVFRQAAAELACSC